MHRLLGIVAVHLCWVAAEMDEVQNPIGVIAVTSKTTSICLAEQHC